MLNGWTIFLLPFFKMFIRDHYGSVSANDERIHPHFIISMNTSFDNELRL